MLTETTGRDPQDLAAELAVLREVDWASVWAGPPQSANELREWCGRYGWEPLTFDRQLRVRTTTGGELSFGNTTTYGSPLVSAGLTACWRVTASGPQDNGAVLAAAARGPTAGHGVLNPAAALTMPCPMPEQQPAGVER
ncbi:hypothetical protein AQI95_02110 [Streptomyces yokosukanensis]|uniref:Uncharacterized protein n=1 Tax=Streptomyces yokosukanensis TaxID=67386 RepID=A0A117Q5Z3_9ACTN|nr:hypothetical protein [Streptomyces yokosukanensis]KUN10526.1 hypothetical protein AQI95_02110 [Streptomyces yokosukanensis]